MYIVHVKVATSLTPENCCLVGILLLDLDSWWNFFTAAPTRLSSRTQGRDPGFGPPVGGPSPPPSSAAAAAASSSLSSSPAMVITVLVRSPPWSSSVRSVTTLL